MYRFFAENYKNKLIPTPILSIHNAKFYTNPKYPTAKSGRNSRLNHKSARKKRWNHKDKKIPRPNGRGLSVLPHAEFAEPTGHKFCVVLLHCMERSNPDCNCVSLYCLTETGTSRKFEVQGQFMLKLLFSNVFAIRISHFLPNILIYDVTSIVGYPFAMTATTSSLGRY